MKIWHSKSNNWCIIDTNTIWKNKKWKGNWESVKGRPSIEVLQLSERLKQYNRNNINNNNSVPPFRSSTPSFDVPPYFPPSPSIDSNIEDDLHPTQKFPLGHMSQKEEIALTVDEKTKKVRFSGNLHELFPKTDKIFDHN